MFKFILLYNIMIDFNQILDIIQVKFTLTIMSFIIFILVFNSKLDIFKLHIHLVYKLI